MRQDFAVNHFTSTDEPTPCPNATIFLHGLIEFVTQHRHPHANKPFVFRGTGNSKHRLVPSSLRTKEEHPSAHRNLWAINRYQVESPESPDEHSQRTAEFCVLREFFQYADSAGLPLPHMSAKRLQQLRTESPNLLEITGKMPGFNTQSWPPTDFHEILGLAQHYDLPTRLLDWTFSLFTAMFFAASGALKRLESNDDPDSLFCVWLLPTIGADQYFYDVSRRYHQDGIATGGHKEEHSIRIVQPPTAQNPNLRCQQGVFTVILDNRDLLNSSVMPDRRSLDDRLRNSIDTAAKERKNRISSLFASFVSCHLSIRHAPELLSILRQFGYSSNRIFDGFHGAASAVIQDAVIKQQKKPLANATGGRGGASQRVSPRNGTLGP